MSGLFRITLISIVVVSAAPLFGGPGTLPKQSPGGDPTSLSVSKTSKTWTDPGFPDADIGPEYVQETLSPNGKRKLVSLFFFGINRETRESIYLQGGSTGIVDFDSQTYPEDLWRKSIKGSAEKSSGGATWTPDSKYCVVNLFSLHGCCTTRICLIRNDGGPPIPVVSARNLDGRFEVPDNDTITFLVYKSRYRGELKESIPSDPGTRFYVSIRKLILLADKDPKSRERTDFYRAAVR